MNREQEDKLIALIGEHLRAGKKKKEIITTLKKDRWNTRDIARAFAVIDRTVSHQYNRKVLPIIAVTIALTIIAIIVLYKTGNIIPPKNSRRAILSAQNKQRLKAFSQRIAAWKGDLQENFSSAPAQ
ncbi:hypothetical protein M1534_00680 [Patescibacteria group bacterium]|nr:hypothetical protein [Patescibacteria group bacterium]